MSDRTTPRREADRTAKALVQDFRGLQVGPVNDDPEAMEPTTVSPQTAKAFAAQIAEPK